MINETLSAYTDEHIIREFDEVRKNGLSEHGFPRLTVNIGILVANGYRSDLRSLFLEMMDFCCEEIPKRKAANDFSVREIVCCIEEAERSGVFPQERIEKWKRCIASIDPYTCYSIYALTPRDPVRNWALFSGTSEFFRLQAGLSGDRNFVETQVEQQLQFLDENGMYMDRDAEPIHQPMVYDVTPRILFSLLLARNYDGPCRDAIEDALLRAADCSLKMQSVTGSMPFGGRSNQFLHNEAALAAVFEYAAVLFKKNGDPKKASLCKTRAALAISELRSWLAREPKSHIKNRFPWQEHHGCEKYAYFDKYMITVASNLYSAYLLSDESIEQRPDDETVSSFQTSEHFHKVFLNAGGYSLEFDLSGHTAYDATGLGRIHKKGAPETIAMSVPCPKDPHYRVKIDPSPLAFSSGVRNGNGYLFSADGEASVKTLSVTEDKEKRSASASFEIRFPSGDTVRSFYCVSENGVTIRVTGDGDLCYELPAFFFDGEKETKISYDRRSASVSYEAWRAVYESNGEIIPCDTVSPNRNGYYKRFLALGRGELQVTVTIRPDSAFSS